MMHTVWLAGAIAMTLPFALSLWGLARRTKADRLAAMQISSGIGVIELAMLSFAFDQPAALDVAFTLGLLSLPGTLMFALFEERWL